ncbi:hypothetical protein F3Y22_tig00113279pilonHSYRG00040 [Hibiscus syriacus]|uniref:Uncharacterized protein n=1 Tax=Hibiscus syriacus TaxID=106335 RepID=A0A6A2X298_HIBSY|nr:hypothetical protein F3Y22_tig00113279pilonHSYRG00040 [Hibiscus syriacus]
MHHHRRRHGGHRWTRNDARNTIVREVSKTGGRINEKLTEIELNLTILPTEINDKRRRFTTRGLRGFVHRSTTNTMVVLVRRTEVERVLTDENLGLLITDRDSTLEFWLRECGRRSPCLPGDLRRGLLCMGHAQPNHRSPCTPSDLLGRHAPGDQGGRHALGATKDSWGDRAMHSGLGSCMGHSRRPRNGSCMGHSGPWSPGKVASRRACSRAWMGVLLWRDGRAWAWRSLAGRSQGMHGDLPGRWACMATW